MATSTKSKSLSTEEIRQKVTDRIIQALENGTKPWIKPWNCSPNAGAPVNIASKKRYRGVNPLMLNCESMEKGYSAKYWGTYKQWKDKEGQVRRGEKGTIVVFWKIIDKIDENGKEKKIFFLRYSTVFNLDQIDGKKLDKYRVDEDSVETFDHETYIPAETIIEESGADITYGGNRACYDPNTDGVYCPSKDRFPKLSEYYNTIFHELTHWTEKRTGFDKDGVKRDYALGELVAEMGSCFVAEEIGVPVEDKKDDQSAAYIAGWLKALKNDNKFIFTASKWANKAADLLLGESSSQE